MAESPALPAASAKDIFHNAMLLSTEAKHYQKVIEFGALADKAGGMDDKEQTALAQSYYFLGEYDKSAAVAQKAVDAAVAAGRVPDRGALQLILTSQVKAKDQAGAQRTLETLVQDFGDTSDWGEEIDLTLGTKGLTDIDVLNLYRLRVLANGTVPPADYPMMAGVAVHLGYPGEAAAMLERGNVRGAALTAARAKEAEDKRTLPSFDALARKRATGDYDVKLAEAYYGYGRYAEAEEAARRAISKGGTKDPHEAQMVLGMALTAQGKNAEALQVLGQVKGSPAIEKVAHVWTLYAGRKYGGADASAPATAAAPATTPAH
jgi:tetratricopeptide (TPR) repeat protein